MTFIAVRCPYCQSDQIVKRGKTAKGIDNLTVPLQIWRRARAGCAEPGRAPAPVVARPSAAMGAIASTGDTGATRERWLPVVSCTVHAASGQTPQEPEPGQRPCPCVERLLGRCGKGA